MRTCGAAAGANLMALWALQQRHRCARALGLQFTLIRAKPALATPARKPAPAVKQHASLEF